MPVLDGIGDGLAGGDEHVMSLVLIHLGAGQPAAQGGSGGSQLADVRRKVHFQRGGMAVEQ